MTRRTAAIGVLAAAALASTLFVGAGRSWFLSEQRDDDGTQATAPSVLEGDRTPGMSSAAQDRDGALAAKGPTDAATTSDLPAPVDLEKVDRDLDLHGTVVDADGKPVAGAELATVTYPYRRADILSHDRYYESLDGARTKSASDGTFVLRLRRGASVALRVSAAGFAPIEKPDCCAGQRVKIVLRPGVTLVVEAKTPEGTPAAGAVFTLNRAGYRGDVAFHRSATTGPDGVARWDDLPPGVNAYLESDVSAWGDTEWSDIKLPESGTSTVRMQFEGGRTITGRVTDAGTKAPIAGASVGMNWTLHRAVKTDGDGRYELKGWTGKGIQDVHVLAEGYGRSEKLVGSASVFDFELSKGDTVAGRVVGPDGKPIAGATVAVVGSGHRDDQQLISMADGSSGSDGRFSLSGLRREIPHVLVVMPVGFGRTLVDFDPSPAGPGVIDVGDVRVPPSRMVIGRVRRSDGSRVEGVRVRCTGANADRARLRGGKSAIDLGLGYGEEEETRPDDAGRFAFVDLSPGTYTLEAWAPGMPQHEKTIRVEDDADPPPVEIEFPAGRSVRIVVVDEDGKPVPWAYVMIPGAGGPNNTVTPVDANGSVTLVASDSADAVQIHAWEGRAGIDERRFVDGQKTVAIDPGATEVRCVLHTGVVISGRVVGPDGKPLAHVGFQCASGGTVAASGYADDEGKFEATVPRGAEYMIELDGSLFTGTTIGRSGLSGAAGPVAPGAKDVVIEARKDATLHRQDVRVVDPDGRPVAGAKVIARWAQGSAESSEVTTDSGGLATVADLPPLPIVLSARPANESGDLVSTSLSVPRNGTFELRLRRGVRVRIRVDAPAALSDAAVWITLVQGHGMRRMKLPPEKRTLSVLLDPEGGATGQVSASASTTSSEYSARLDNVRFGEGEVVLTLEPAK